MDTIDAGRIKIQKWVIHEIPQVVRVGDASDGPHLSESISPYDDEVARFFEQKIAESVGKSCHPIEPLDGSSVAASVASCLDGETDLLGVSIGLAKSLFAAQNGAMSAGLLVVMQAEYMGNSQILAVVKLEKERGARAEQNELNGKSTYTVQYLKDLFFTNRTRVFKIALFAKKESESVTGWITDPQARGADIARFYLTNFLEFRLTNEPRTSTKNFHAAAEKYIDKNVDDPMKKARYETAVIADLNGNSSEVSISNFASRHLDLEDRDKFQEFMRTEGVEDYFVKDIHDIKTRIQRMQYTFEQGVRVNVPTESSDTVSLTKTEDGLTELKVRDSLDSVKSRA